MILTVYIDGAARGNPGPAGIGIVIKKGEGTIKEIADYIGEATNNVAEYTAFVCGLERVIHLKATEVHFYSDSELLVKQIKGEYQVKNAGLKPFYLRATSLIKKLKKFSISHIPREKNLEADMLANCGIDEQTP
ncbi:MAG: ribonuclease HI family protein [Candidatus Margulisiibacteriota bacterium]